MDFQEFKEAVIQQAKALGITEYELYYRSSASTTVSAFQHEMNKFSGSLDGGVCFRAMVNGKMGYASTEELSKEQAQSVVARAVDNASVLESDDPVFLNVGGQKYEALELKPYPLPSTEELIKTMLDTQEKLYAADKRVTDGTETEAISETTSIAIYNSKGLDLCYENRIAGLITSAVVSDGTESESSFQIKLGQLDTIDTKALAEETVQKAIRKLGGEAAPTAVCPVVFSPDAMADLLETFSPIFSAAKTQKGLSRLAGAEGEAIASPVVTLVDDPFCGKNPMPIHFDAEGSPTYRKNIIENGVLKTLLYNLQTANKAGKATTGNASKKWYNDAVDIQPFTMYLAPGQWTEDELLKKADVGVYINALSGLHAGASAVTGDFSLQSAGFLIEGGRKTKAVKSFTVAGNFYERLKKITAVADNMELPAALGITAFGAPSVLVENLSIAGK